MLDDFNPELVPGEQVGGELSAEQAARADAWETAMSDMGEMGEEDVASRNEGIADAAALINYGLNAAARELGVEVVVQRIKSFDPSGSSNPVRDLYIHLGIDEPGEKADLRDEAMASKKDEAAFRASENAPATVNKSMEGALEAIKDFKELVMEVEGADPRYKSLREGAKIAGKGIFEYAVMQYGVRDLTVLFSVLAQQKETAEEKEEVPATEEEEEKEEDKNDDLNTVDVSVHDENANLL